jgi:hypothetical protein
MPENRSFATGNFALELGGAKCGFAKSFRGGGAFAEVINDPVGPEPFVKKHIGQPRYDDIELKVGLGMTDALYDWIATSWEQKYMRKDGAVAICDLEGKERSRRKFVGALISEVTVPKLDAAAKEPAYLTVKLSPEIVRDKKGSGAKAAVPVGQGEQKLFMPSNFRLTIDGLDCTRVSKIDALTVRQTAVTDDVGEMRDSAKEPGKIEFPNLEITLAATSAESWSAWFADFVIAGNNGDDRERQGKIELLAPNRQTVLATITLLGLGIYRLDDDWTAAETADKVRRVQAGLYCEQMKLGVGRRAAQAETVQPADRLASVTDRVGSIFRR